MMTNLNLKFISLLALAILTLFGPVPAFAHCDTMAGPVVGSARRALDTGDVSLALRWVRPQDEDEVKQVFVATRRVRSLSPEARELADRHFFETLVRLHRAGEGEPYTGLKDVADAAELAIDRALDAGDIGFLLPHFPADAAAGIHPRFQRVVQARRHADDNLAAGREYVATYIDLIHFLHEAGAAKPEHESHAKAAAPHATRAEIERFTAAKTQLKKNSESSLTLAFRIEPAGAEIDWRLACEGVVITGWDSKQLLSISERGEGGAIQSIEGRGFVGTNPSVVITVKRPKAQSPAHGSCVAGIHGADLATQEKTITFEVR